MFYQLEMDNTLRFGDILGGFILSAPNIAEPASCQNYKIEITTPTYCVVLSPCCSIGNKVISLSPLIKLLGSFFNNPFFVEDLTRINREMEPKQAVSPSVWEQLPPEEKQKRLNEKRGYALTGFFVYGKHDLLPKYPINRKQGNIETNYYMIDFKNIHKINCDKINSAKDAPLKTKLLQLSISARSELREKLSYFYARVPAEDKVE